MVKIKSVLAASILTTAATAEPVDVDPTDYFANLDIGDLYADLYGDTDAYDPAYYLNMHSSDELPGDSLDEEAMRRKKPWYNKKKMAAQKAAAAAKKRKQQAAAAAAKKKKEQEDWENMLALHEAAMNAQLNGEDETTTIGPPPETEVPDLEPTQISEVVPKPDTTPKPAAQQLAAGQRPQAATETYVSSNSRPVSQSGHAILKAMDIPNNQNKEFYKVVNPLNAIQQAIVNVLPDVTNHLSEPNTDGIAVVKIVGADIQNQYDEVEYLADKTTHTVLSESSMLDAKKSLASDDCKNYGICTSADYAVDYNKYEKVKKKQNKKENLKFQSVARTGVDHEFTGVEIIELQNYGCWCPKLLREKWTDALMGVPIDGLDKICRDWWRCKRCTSLDPYHCPMKMDYVYDVTHFNNAGALSCEGIEDDCTYYNCLCDQDMALNIVSNMHLLNVTWIGVEPEECVRTDVVGGVEIDSCCGDTFPNVTPYGSAQYICVDGEVHDMVYY